MADVLEEQEGAAFEVLTQEECIARLDRGSFGRVAITAGEVAAVLPVNYSASGGIVSFRTGPGMKLDAARRRATVSFEIDGIDRRYHQGWSVLAVGSAQLVDEPENDGPAGADPQPWAPGGRDFLVRIEPTFLSGRRIAFCREP
jgi:nitroimidazol reductase NimA-like FMN-containing flavoprotein (pyridoxamine 5'-phosphate oxidase superfamily)